jgi:hypothetical protein
MEGMAMPMSSARAEGYRWLTRLLSRAASSLALVGLLVVAAGAITGLQVLSALPALAASVSARGPSAAVDSFENEYVFWKGTDGNLWEALHNSYTNRWSTHDLKMGPLGSEPTVAVTNQVFRGPGGKLFNAVYVYWRGTSGGLFFAYWNGHWHASDLGIKPICSQPSATFVTSPFGPKIVIFWKGLGVSGSCSRGPDINKLWYAFSTSFPPTGPGDYSGPTLDTHAQFVGSSPSITTVRSTCAPDALCDKYVVIAWQGTSGYLWEEVWNQANGDVSGPTRDTRAGVIGSAPSVGAISLEVGSSAPVDTWDVTWRGTSGHLLYAHPSTANINVGAIPFGASSGALGSAPTIAEGQKGTGPPADFHDIFIFWKGGPPHSNLFEAFYNGHSGHWHIYPLGMGPLG